MRKFICLRIVLGIIQGITLATMAFGMSFSATAGESGGDLYSLRGLKAGLCYREPVVRHCEAGAPYCVLELFEGGRASLHVRTISNPAQRLIFAGNKTTDDFGVFYFKLKYSEGGLRAEVLDTQRISLLHWMNREEGSLVAHGEKCQEKAPFN